MRRKALVPLCLCAAMAAPSFAQRSGPMIRRGPGTRPTPAVNNGKSTPTKSGDKPTTPGAKAAEKPPAIIVNLSKGVDVKQIIEFISQQANKPVLPASDVSGKIKVYSADKVPPGEALQLIYDALEMAGIAVIETPRLIKLVKADKAKTMQIPILQPGDSASSLTNKSQIVQKIFKLVSTSPKSLNEALKPLVGTQGNIAVDERTKTVIVTDTVANIERFELLVDAFDRVDVGQMILKVFKLQFADAEDLSELVATMAVAGEGGKLEVQGRDRYSGYSSSYRRRYGISSGGRVAGDVVVIPDQRTNWLIVAGPPDKVQRIEELVEQLDVQGRLDAQIYVIEIKHADAWDVASDIENLFEQKMRREKREVLDLDASNRGNQIMVLATPTIYKQVLELVKEIDTIDAVQRETRTYVLKFMDAEDMAEQLNLLYEQEFRRSYSPWDWGYPSRSSSSREQAKFVPSVRTNSIMVIASPKEYDFIEELINELDVEIPIDNLAPRVYHITHTDAAEMVNVLTELFQGQQTQRPGGFNPFGGGWRPRNRRDGGSDTIGALSGKVRFVPYTNTNSIVVITNNSQNFAVVEKLIEDLDVLDPEATNMLVIQLQHADATKLANAVNNLLSEGAVARAGQQRQQQQQGGGDEEQLDIVEEVVDAILPWQSAQRRQRRPGERLERPISSMIGQVRIMADERSQKLIIAAPSIYFDAIKKLIEDLDKPEPQVQLETFIIRIEEAGEQRIGWRWTPDPSSITPEELDNAVGALLDMGFVDTFAGRGGPFQVFNEDGTRARGTPYNINSTGGSPWGQNASFAFDQVLQPGKGVISTEVNLTVLLQLLIKNRNASVMAHPQVTVNNNERGEIFIGESVPFITGETSSREGLSTDKTFEYRDVGTRLLITPKINTEGRVVLSIVVENSRRKPETIGGGVVTDLQTYTTKMTVENGQTVWMGGLREQREDNVIRKFPILGNIPYFGYFFRKTDKVTLTSQIYTLVKPVVIQSPEQATAQFRKARGYIEDYQQEYERLDFDLPEDDFSTTGMPKADAGAPPAETAIGAM